LESEAVRLKELLDKEIAERIKKDKELRDHTNYGKNLCY